jgi:hypothetical protein
MGKKARQVVECTNARIVRNLDDECIEAILYAPNIEKAVSEGDNGNPSLLKERGCRRFNDCFYRFANVSLEDFAEEFLVVCDEEEIPEPELTVENAVVSKRLGATGWYHVYSFDPEVQKREVMSVFDVLSQIYQRIRK